MARGAGQYDRRVLIQQRLATQNTTGEEVESWVNWAQVWARFEPAGGGEGVAAEQRTALQTARFFFRWIPGVVPTMQIVYDGEVWNITNVAEPVRRRELVIDAEAREVKSGA